MNKKIYFLNLCLAVLIGSNTFAQSVINYSTATINDNSCNDFNVTPQVSVNGFLHWPVSGGAIYHTYNGSTAKYLQLNAQYNSSAQYNDGTAYAISYAFTKGFTYSINLNAAFGGGTQGPQQVAFPVITFGILTTLNPNYTNPTACGAVGNNYWSAIGGLQEGGSFQISQSGNYTYPAINFVAPVGYNYLSVLGTSSSTTSPGPPVVALLNSITISKTANLPLSPATLPIQCGNTTAQTFTVSNPNSIAGIQSYTWNLGANNGWLYNGSAAPATIPTSGNTLTLTPVCGGTQKSITASATISGTSYPANNAATVSSTAATPALNGNIVLCTGSSNYTITGLPCNATVAWSVTPSGIATLSPNGASATLTKVSNGVVTLKATITSTCSVSPLSASISVGQAPPVNITGGPNGCNGNASQWDLSASPVSYGSNWYWYVSFLGTNASIYFSNNGNPTTVCSVIGGGIVGLSYTDLCGVTQSTTYTVYSQCGSPNIVKTAPNPTTGNLTVSLAPSTQTKTESLSTNRMIYQIKVINQNGVLLKEYSYNSGVASTNLDLSSLPNGTYILQIFNNVTWSSQQVVLLK